MEENNARIKELQRTGIELWYRAETWKKALEHINTINNDPIIARYIKRALQQENI